MNTTPPKKRGRPIKYPKKGYVRLADLMTPDTWPILFRKSKPRGRPRQTYYGLPIEKIVGIVDGVMADIFSENILVKRYNQRKILGLLLEKLRRDVGGYYDMKAVERAIRRYRADKNLKKSK